MSKKLESNVFKTALLFEGGSMRACYSSAVAVWLLEQGIYFDKVYGVSAGSSNAVNYLSRDIQRTKVSFTDFIGNPNVGNWKTALMGKGIFNAHFIYQEAGRQGACIPFDFDTFKQNPADCCIVSYDRDTGDDLFFTKQDVNSLNDIMIRVRASSTLPIMMPPPVVDGRVCYDGGFADGGGLPLHRINEDGYDRVVVIRTRKRGFRKDKSGDWAKLAFWNKPAMKEAVLTRWSRYNDACDLLDRWEKEGRAYVFYCDDITVSGTERDVDLLKGNYEMGYAQISREWSKMYQFITNSENR